jgi:hypothetical protein
MHGFQIRHTSAHYAFGFLVSCYFATRSSHRVLQSTSSVSRAMEQCLSTSRISLVSSFEDQACEQSRQPRRIGRKRDQYFPTHGFLLRAGSYSTLFMGCSGCPRNSVYSRCLFRSSQCDDPTQLLNVRRRVKGHDIHRM